MKPWTVFCNKHQQYRLDIAIWKLQELKYTVNAFNGDIESQERLVICLEKQIEIMENFGVWLAEHKAK